MSSAERRPAFAPGKVARRHPAEPVAPPRTPASVPSTAADEGLVMLCVRVHPSLRRRLKLASASCGRPLQSLAVEAFEEVCQEHGV